MGARASDGGGVMGMVDGSNNSDDMAGVTSIQRIRANADGKVAESAFCYQIAIVFLSNPQKSSVSFFLSLQSRQLLFYSVHHCIYLIRQSN